MSTSDKDFENEHRLFIGDAPDEILHQFLYSRVDFKVARQAE